MDFTFTTYTPATSTRQKNLAIRVPLSDRSPIKSADNTFNPTNTSRPRRPRGPNIKPKQRNNQIIIVNRENHNPFTESIPTNEDLPLLATATPLSQTRPPNPYEAYSFPSPSSSNLFVYETPCEPLFKRPKTDHNPLPRAAEFLSWQTSTPSHQPGLSARGRKRKASVVDCAGDVDEIPLPDAASQPTTTSLHSQSPPQAVIDESALQKHSNKSNGSRLS
ncbi:hypothetical protein E1B28_002972 [Marasmius oreades]|uniref:Uncharacterized protein n=1 Tax=Marasmius oreades TaxID=181124 RepID=A0A9P7ULQ4_9AGAR|nr:uncharacterized protein E1B28_002972 [Marasmius oreades]KAG7085411.1 hypothetical protein E1B28_002972 [Marasmius oreades]